MWEIDDIIGIANKWLILQNRIVSMKMNGDFRDGADALNLITELYTDEVQLNAEAVAKYEAKRVPIRNEIFDDWQEQGKSLFPCSC